VSFAVLDTGAGCSFAVFPRRTGAFFGALTDSCFLLVRQPQTSVWIGGVPLLLKNFRALRSARSDEIDGAALSYAHHSTGLTWAQSLR